MTFAKNSSIINAMKPRLIHSAANPDACHRERKAVSPKGLKMASLSLFLRFAQDFRRTLRRSRSALSTLSMPRINSENKPRCLPSGYTNVLILLEILFVLIFSVSAFAGPTIKAEVDKANISTDESLTYKLIITSEDSSIPAPHFPKFQDFIVLSQAESSTMSFAKAGAKTILVYAFILAAKNSGKFKIEPSQIKIGSSVYSSEGFDIEVTQGKRKTQPPPRYKPPLPKQTEPETEEPKVTL